MFGPFRRGVRPPMGVQPPGSFSGVSNVFREAEHISVRILDVEVSLAPGPLLKWLDDGSAATDELVVQLADSGEGKVCVEMLF